MEGKEWRNGYGAFAVGYGKVRLAGTVEGRNNSSTGEKGSGG